MNRKPLFWILVLALALVAGWQLASAQGEKADVKEKPVQKWEYKMETDPTKLDALGNDGWELVSVEPPAPFVRGNMQMFETTKRAWHFKRPK